MIMILILILLMIRELFNFLKGELKGKTDVTSVVAIIALRVVICLH